VYSTLAVRTGASVNIVEGSNLLAGFRYEPASLGPGSREDGGKSGYGTLELVKLFAGMDDLRPYWEAALGLERSFGKKRGAGRSKSPAAASFHPWTARLGLTYRRASLGIDEDGELPGAYLHTKVTIPAQLTYMF
jgi:hypothetical protein